MGDVQQLDVSKAQKKIWLVKVPQSVAAQWRAICEQAVDPSNLEDDAPPMQLGSMVIKQSEGRRPEAMLNVAGTADKPDMPSSFKLVQLSVQPGSVTAVSLRPGEGTDPPTQARIEGVVSESFNAMPIAMSDTKGGIVVDEQYRALSRVRSEQAGQAARSVQVFEHTRKSTLEVLRAKRSHQVERLKPEEVKRVKEENKRVRADPPILERELFKLFESKPVWTFSQLQNETAQPAPHLKSVLSGIAAQFKSGPQKGMWALKKDYQLGGGAAPDAPL